MAFAPALSPLDASGCSPVGRAYRAGLAIEAKFFALLVSSNPLGGRRPMRADGLAGGDTGTEWRTARADWRGPRENMGLRENLVAVALNHADVSGSAAVWSRVPAHAADVRQALETCGFAVTGSDLVIKRSLAIRVRDVAPTRETKRKVARSGLTVTQSRALEAQDLGSGAPEAAQGSRLR